MMDRVMLSQHVKPSPKKVGERTEGKIDVNYKNINQPLPHTCYKYSRPLPNYKNSAEADVAPASGKLSGALELD